MINGVLSDFWYWLNSDILVFSEGIIILQKSLFLHTFLCDSSLVFALKAIQAINAITVMFRCSSS